MWTTVYETIVDIAGDFVDSVLPELCVVCRMPITGKRIGPFALCRSCFDALPRISGERCVRCGCELISEIDICTRCRERTFFFESNVSLFRYEGTARAIIHAYKFDKKRRFAWFFARELSHLFSERFAGSTVIPVPPRKKPIGIGKWEHVGAITHTIKGRHGVAVVPALHRSPSKPQKSLDYEARLKNLSGAFYVAEKYREVVPKRGDLVIVDDVFTTGATATECARVLLDAGARRVRVMTIATD